MSWNPKLLCVLLISACVVGDGEPASPSVDGPADADLLASGAALTWPRLALGDSNPSVTALQYVLAAVGFPAPKTGALDAVTEAAVRELQRARALPVSGVVGPTTWEALVADATLEAGDTGAAVEGLQYLLQRRHGASLSITGTLGPTTLGALRAFQTSRCLAATGVVGRFTWNALIADRSFCRSGLVAAAGRVLAAHRAGTVTLWDQTFGRADGADPLANITATAAGQRARTSCYGGAPCTSVVLSERLVTSMAALRDQRGFRYFVTSIAGASHSAGSLHYQGRAFDIDEVDGVRIAGDSATARAFMAACRELGAIEVLGPSNDAGHQDHIHCAW